MNRQQFIKSGLLTTKIFLNAAAFLRIAQEEEESSRGSKNQRRGDDEHAADPLDDTRIHPEDYELARKMATDALELDEEDVQDDHASSVVSTLMRDPDNEKKLSELNLDDFAVSLFEASQDMKRHTLNVIKEELLKPFSEQRKPFPDPGAWDVLTMLSGQTPKTLMVGLIISVLVQRITKGFVAVRLDSGIEGVISAQHLSDHAANPGDVVSRGQMISAVVCYVKLDLDHDHFLVELSSSQSELAKGDDHIRRVKPDEAWDHQRYDRDRDIKERKKRAEVSRARRVIKHPNFHNFNTAQAEAYLDKQQRGDVVIRPSSKGTDHLAVTWKVDDNLYQHIGMYLELLLGRYSFAYRRCYGNEPRP